MSQLKMHIKRDSKSTLCGCGWTVWRNGTKEVYQSDGSYSYAPKEYIELPTSKYINATCMTCLKGFKLLAQLMSEEGNLLALLTIGQSHQTRFMKKYYPKSVQHGA